MPVERAPGRRAIVLACVLAVCPAYGATPVTAAAAPPTAAAPKVASPPATAQTPQAPAAASEAELLEFLAEFSTVDGAFVDPFALDKVGKAVDKEIAKLDAKAASAEKAAPPVAKEDDDDQ